MKSLAVSTFLCLLAVNAIAQDPLQLLPNAYKLEFENEWVKIVRVHYAPHEKLPAHEHTPTASAYVYLSDGGPVVFNHKEYYAVTRPATKAGSFRVYKGLQEHHEVENQSDLPSDFLRVEFKTEPVDEKSLKGRFYREDFPVDQNYQKVQFENEQIRITRLVCAPRKTLELSSGSSQPALLIALSSVAFKKEQAKGKAQPLKLGVGQTAWIPEDRRERFQNIANAPAEVLRFDFKTRTLSKEELEKNSKHDHPN